MTTSSSSSGPPTKCRPDFPIFNGEKVHGWIDRVRRLSDFYFILDGQRVKDAALILVGAPLQWYQWLEKEKVQQLTWEEFEQALLKRFGPSEFLDYKGALTKLQQTGSLSDYQTQFEKLANFVNGLSEDFFLFLFGLVVLLVE